MTARTADSRTFARQLLQVELATVLSNPFSRPIGWILLLGAIPAGASVSVWLPPLPEIAAAVSSYLIALLIVTAAYAIAAPHVESRAFDAAPYRWLQQSEAGQCGAYARPDKQSRLTLYSVWANPRSHGLGSALLVQILMDTAPAGDLWLIAVNQRAANFYLRYGFRHVRRELLGHRMVLERSPRSDI